MRRVRLRRPSPALVVATLALIVALTGPSFADVKRLVSGDKLVKKHSLSANRLRQHTLTRTQINMAKLGTVPKAALADNITAPEAFHEIGGPNAPSFQNGCGNVGGGTGTAAFFVDREGVVHLRGRYMCPNAGDTAFVLPSGYRPGGLQQFALASAGPGAVVAISDSGTVACGTTDCFINGITFRAGD
jgi:hypothetical protein